MEKAAIILLASIAILVPSSADAKSKTKGRAAIEEAKRAMRVPKYAQAIDALERALDDSTLERNDRLEALELLASAHIARDDASRAEAVYETLLDLAPGHDLPEAVSPKIRAVFDRVKTRRIRPPQLGSVTATLAGDHLKIFAAIDDPDAQAEALFLETRTDGGQPARTSMSADNGVFTASVAIAKTTARLDYAVVLRDRTGRELGGDRTASIMLRANEKIEAPPVLSIKDTPRIVETTARPEPEDSIVTRWWFWTLIGVAVAGSAGAIVYFTRSTEPPEDAGNLSPAIQLP